MDLIQLATVRTDLENFVALFKESFGRKERVYWCHQYLSGLMLNGERKSIQPMAERLPNGNEQAMQQFVNQSPWDHKNVQEKLAQYMAKNSNLKKGVLVLDDTTLPKKGHHSVGVAHQYCGALGKIANCQSVVTWQYCELNGVHFPINSELYLPKSWISNKEKMVQALVPENRSQFLKKWEIALQLFDQISKEIFPYKALVFDAGYGEIREFLRELDRRKLVFVAQIPENHAFWASDVKIESPKEKTNGRPRTYPKISDRTQKPLSARLWREKLLKDGVKFRKIQLPLQSKKQTEVIAIRVKETHSHAFYRPGADRWLIVEKVGDQYKYYSSNAEEKESLENLVLWAHERWKIEQNYQQLKEELGLDHFEGRSWRGLHHHITLCFMAYDFLILQKGKKNFSHLYPRLGNY